MLNQTVTDLVAEVQNQKAVDQGILTVVNGLAAQVQAGIDAGDLAAIQQAVNDMKDNDALIAAAVTANTPAAPTGTDTGSTDTGSTGGDTSATDTGADQSASGAA